MAEATAEEKALAANGATKDNLAEGSNGQGAPKAPEAPSNAPPVKEGKDEEHGAPSDADKKAADDAAAKVAADAKVVAEAAAAKALAEAGPLTEYITIENPSAQAAINLLKEAGVHPNEANKFFDKAIKSGDLNDIDRAGLEAKIGKDKATLVLNGITSYYDGLKAQTEATVKATHEIFGGEANWKTVKTWAQTAEKADPALKKQIDDVRAMLDEGGTRAAAGGRELLRLFNAAPDTKGLGTSKLAVGDSTGTVIGTNLNRTDYLKELKAAHSRGAKPAEIQAIDARRMSGKRAGI